MAAQEHSPPPIPAAARQPGQAPGPVSTRTVLVTGAARGIGAAIMAALAREGYRVVGVDLLPELLDRAVDELRGEGLDCIGEPCDVADEPGVLRAIATADTDGAPLWGVVNCAALSGVAVKTPVLELAAEAWRRTIDVNLTGVFLVAQAAAREMASRGGGVIVNISSVSGIGAEESAAAYCASKAGVIGLTRAMALDLASSGIRVCAIAPGDITTARSQEVAAATTTRFPKVSPLGAGAPEDVAAAVSFLLGDGARFVSGTTLVVDGALMAY